MSCAITSVQCFLGISLPLLKPITATPTPFHWAYVLLFEARTLSTLLPESGHYYGYSYPFSYIFIPNLISCSLPEHLFKHHHFLYLYLLCMQVLDWQTLHLIQHSRSYNHSIDLSLSFGDMFLSHRTLDASLYFIQSIPIRCATSLLIFYFFGL